MFCLHKMQMFQGARKKKVTLMSFKGENGDDNVGKGAKTSNNFTY